MHAMPKRKRTQARIYISQVPVALGRSLVQPFSRLMPFEATSILIVEFESYSRFLAVACKCCAGSLIDKQL
jgi:hypothetical protein